MYHHQDLLHSPTRRSSYLKVERIHADALVVGRRRVRAQVDLAAVLVDARTAEDVLEFFGTMGVLRARRDWGVDLVRDRKSTRLNSSHLCISYSVFCLIKKK